MGCTRSIVCQHKSLSSHADRGTNRLQINWELKDMSDISRVLQRMVPNRLEYPVSCQCLLISCPHGSEVRPVVKH